ncbi:Yip1-domain-containing protein [Irpex rosettiformis]|uniref:Yip1-domain-containing protein n=1 Tax=Irpex rosettiformis TaxID=378272 RepID=A0ACB8UAH1_9APHY|nr:Yip1-domain-containing protein [Irpex rosettiformis]
MQRPEDSLTTPLTSTSQFIQADDDDDLDEEAIPGFAHPTIGSDTPQSAVFDKGKGRATEQLATPTSAAGPARTPTLSGNIGSMPSGVPSSARRTIGGVQVENRFTGVDTLDEPITTTIGRDLLSIYTKLVQVLYPPKGGASREVLRDWDLWGPFVLCLLLGILLSLKAPASQSLGIFTSVVAIISLGSLVVTIQAKLLGGRVSFFQGLCVFGYCVAPLNVAAFVSTFVHLIYVRVPIALAAWAWCVWGKILRTFPAVNFLDGTRIEQQRILLAVYPLLLFYFILAWMIIIQ